MTKQTAIQFTGFGDQLKDSLCAFFKQTAFVDHANDTELRIRTFTMSMGLMGSTVRDSHFTLLHKFCDHCLTRT